MVSNRQCTPSHSARARVYAAVHAIRSSAWFGRRILACALLGRDRVSADLLELRHALLLRGNTARSLE